MINFSLDKFILIDVNIIWNFKFNGLMDKRFYICLDVMWIIYLLKIFILTTVTITQAKIVMLCGLSGNWSMKN